MLKNVWRGLRILLLVWVGLVILYGVFQRSFIYYPMRAAEGDLLREAQAVGFRPWRDAAGALIGWCGGTAGGAQRLVVFHGNAGYALHRVEMGALFQSLPANPGDCEVFLFEYPGYGARDGEPSEKAFFETARAAVDGLLAAGGGRLFLIGESIGTGTACHLAGKLGARVDGVLLITPFDNFANVGSHHFPFLPVNLLLSDRFDNATALAPYPGPVAFVLAGEDEVVPAQLGQSLHDGYPGRKRMWVVAGSGHNTLPYHRGEPVWTEAAGFLGL